MAELSLVKLSSRHWKNKTTLVQVVAWCRQAASVTLSQCLPKSLSSYEVDIFSHLSSLLNREGSQFCVDSVQSSGSLWRQTSWLSSGDGLMPVRRQAITWSKCWPLDDWNKLRWNLIKIQIFSAYKYIWKCCLQNVSHLVWTSMCWLTVMYFPVAGEHQLWPREDLSKLQVC